MTRPCMWPSGFKGRLQFRIIPSTRHTLHNLSFHGRGESDSPGYPQSCCYAKAQHKADGRRMTPHSPPFYQLESTNVRGITSSVASITRVPIPPGGAIPSRPIRAVASSTSAVAAGAWSIFPGPRSGYSGGHLRPCRCGGTWAWRFRWKNGAVVLEPFIEEGSAGGKEAQDVRNTTIWCT